MNEYVIGIDLGGTSVELIAGDHSLRKPTGVNFSPEQLKKWIDHFIESHDLKPTGIGVAVPGLVDEGVIKVCDVLPRFEGWSATENLVEYEIPVTMLNDVRAALMYQVADVEKAFTGGVIMVGTAVGASFMVDGRELKGKNNWAGELGYFPLCVNEDIKRLDELSGGSFMATDLGLSAEEMYQLALAGDDRVIARVKKGGAYLGYAIAGVINLLNPDRIFIGGGTTHLPHYWDSMIKAIEKATIPILYDPDVVKAISNERSIVALGAIKALGDIK